MFKRFSHLLKPSAKQDDAAALKEIADTQLTIRQDMIFLETDGQEPQPLLTNGELDLELTEDAKVHIAQKIARLLPDLEKKQKMALLGYTLEALKILGKDQLTRVRQMVAEELKHSKSAPHDLIMDLAWDKEIIVAGPVLEYSPILTDQDLIDIIIQSDMPGIQDAISKRPRLAAAVTDAIISCKSASAISQLLGNKNAEISNQGYGVIIEDMPKHKSWHEPLVRREDLPNRVINKIAAQVSDSLLTVLGGHYNITDKDQSGLAKGINKRLQSTTHDSEKTSESIAKDLHAQGALDDEAIEEALLRSDRKFVIAALSILSGFDLDTIKRILRTENPKVITAMCWQAKLSMRMAKEVQLRLGRIHHQKLLLPKGGHHYPLPTEEMELFLDIYRR